MSESTEYSFSKSVSCSATEQYAFNDNVHIKYDTNAAPAHDERQAFYYRSKRILDVTVSVVALVVLLPIMVAIALAVSLDSSGPAIFKQTRYGRYGRPFRILKFRTMYTDADARLEELRDRNERGGSMFKMTNDPRVTRFGRFLRSTSLDELPQLINVMRGEMSLVGPRPHTAPLWTYEPWQKARLQAPPGITGPAQIWHRHVTFPEESRVDMDYIKRQSLRYDLYLLWNTIMISLLTRTGK